MIIEESDYIMHYGVLGMKWGVRKQKQTSGKKTRKKSFVRKPPIHLEGKTSNGETIKAVQDETPRLTAFIAKHSASFADQISRTKNMTLYNSKGESIGSLQLFHERSGSLNVTWLGVDENQRGKGYATTAMKMAESYAKSSGANYMTLEVPGHSPDARHIYEKQGFKATKVLTTPDEDRVWGGLIAMRKKL